MEDTGHAIIEASKTLRPREIEIVLTRGYENQGRVVKRAHAATRHIAVIFFLCLYLRRFRERKDIFLPMDMVGVVDPLMYLCVSHAVRSTYCLAVCSPEL